MRITYGICMAGSGVTALLTGLWLDTRGQYMSVLTAPWKPHDTIAYVKEGVVIIPWLWFQGRFIAIIALSAAFTVLCVAKMVAQRQSRRCEGERQLRRHTYRQRGSTLIQAIVVLVIMGCMTSLAVDIGIFYVAKLELQRAADAAALAAAADLSDGGTAFSAAQQATIYMQANPVCGRQLAASAMTMTLGSMDNGTFTPNGVPTDAVRVKLERTHALGNPVPLYFAQFVGLSSVDAAAISTAKVRQTPPYNLVGINHASFASLGVLAAIHGRFVSNGDVNVGWPLGLLVGVQGEAHSCNGTVKRGALAGISGSTARLSDALDYPSVTLPPTNDNAQLGGAINSWGDLNLLVAASIPAGRYVVRDLNIVAGVAVQLQGPVTFYVTRNFNLAAAVNLLGDTNFSPSNFKVRVLPGGYVNFLAPILVPLRIDLYAPDSDINIAVGVSAFKGRMIGKTLDIMLPLLGDFTEDQTLPNVLDDLRKISLMK